MAGERGTCIRTGRPTIISASIGGRAAAAWTVPMTRPRRSTVMRSAIPSTSSSLWLMKMMVRP